MKPSEQRVLVAELVDELRQLRLQQTEQWARWQGNVTIRNDVLEVATKTFPTGGEIPLQYPVPAGSVEVNNTASHSVTVTSSPPTGAAPTTGRGVYVVPAGACRVVNVASRQVTLYGTAGDTISYQVLASGTAGRAGLTAVDGGSSS